MKKILFWPGSNRQGSWNSRWLSHLSQMMPPDIEKIHLQSLDFDWPLFNQDDEHRPSLQTEILKTHQKIAQADGLIVASPEFNGMVTPFLKNAVDWISRLAYIREDVSNPFLDKPILLVAASTGGSGGSMGLLSARSLFSYVGACVFGQTLTLPWAQQHWTEMGYLLQEEHNISIDDALKRYIGKCVNNGSHG
jgi:NAD(P)H-dependent FMN reductase